MNYATGSATLPLAENMHYTILVTFEADRMINYILMGAFIGVISSIVFVMLYRFIK